MTLNCRHRHYYYYYYFRHKSHFCIISIIFILLAIITFYNFGKEYDKKIYQNHHDEKVEVSEFEVIEADLQALRKKVEAVTIPPLEYSAPYTYKARELVCPVSSETCKCEALPSDPYGDPGQGPRYHLRCVDSEYRKDADDQSSLYKMVEKLREIEKNASMNVKGQNQNDSDSDLTWLDLHELYVTGSGLLTLDLGVLARTRLDQQFQVHRNDHLTTLSPPTPQEEGTIVVDLVDLGDNRLTDEGLGTALKFFPPNISTLDLGGNRLEGKLLKGQISHLVYLRVLGLGRNQIEHLEPGIFIRLTRLETLDLSGNQLATIGEHVFTFDPPSALWLGSPIEIGLGDNNLTESSFSPNWGLDAVKRPTTLILKKNRLKTIPQIPFEAFLVSQSGNAVNLDGNPLVCDKRLSWLKQNSQIKEYAIESAQCINENVKFLFDSGLF